ncbi:unnamed protein product [Closterium sp. Naga37s-1]|nr:unnamed protein product [Closterium sp. Naga37s-1]
MPFLQWTLPRRHGVQSPSSAWVLAFAVLCSALWVATLPPRLVDAVPLLYVLSQIRYTSTVEGQLADMTAGVVEFAAGYDKVDDISGSTHLFPINDGWTNALAGYKTNNRSATPASDPVFEALDTIVKSPGSVSALNAMSANAKNALSRLAKFMAIRGTILTTDMASGNSCDDGKEGGFKIRMRGMRGSGGGEIGEARERMRGSRGRNVGKPAPKRTSQASPPPCFPIDSHPPVASTSLPQQSPVLVCPPLSLSSRAPKCTCQASTATHLAIDSHPPIASSSLPQQSPVLVCPPLSPSPVQLPTVACACVSSPLPFQTRFQVHISGLHPSIDSHPPAAKAVRQEREKLELCCDPSADARLQVGAGGAPAIDISAAARPQVGAGAPGSFYCGLTEEEVK